MKIFRTLAVLSCSFLIHIFVNASEPVNDFYYPDQWNLHGQGGGINGNFGIGLNYYFDSGVTPKKDNITFIVGSGIKAEHEDLKEAMWVNSDEIASNGIDDDLNGYIDDVHGVNIPMKNGDISDAWGIGTEVASVISAKQDNFVGVAGVSRAAKVASCIFADENGGTVENFEKCVDYIIYLKEDKKEKISSIVLTFGFTLQSNYIAVHSVKPIFEKLSKANILVVAPMRGENDEYSIVPDLDYGYDFPGAYLLPNVITVSGIGKFGNYFGYGDNSIHATAPVNYILTASIDDKYIPSDVVDVIYEQNDIPIEQLDNVSVISDLYYTGNSSWKLNVGEKDSFIQLNPIDLSKYEGSKFILSFHMLSHSERYIGLEYFDEDSNSWSPLGLILMPSKNWQSINNVVNVPDNYNGKLRALKLRLGFHSGAVDELNPAASVFIDEVIISDPKFSRVSDGYSYSGGTVLAAAQVAGAISILNSVDELTMWQVRNLVMSSGELVSDNLSVSRELKTISNKILQIYGSHENGLLDCKDQYLHKRLFPTVESWIARAIGEELIIKGVHINCKESNGPLKIVDTLNNKSFSSVDDGVFPDLIKGDGYNITRVKFDEVGVHTLKVDTDKDIKVLVVDKYQKPIKVPLAYKEDKYVVEYGSGNVDSPFHINVGNVKTTKCLSVDMSYGWMLLHDFNMGGQSFNCDPVVEGTNNSLKVNIGNTEHFSVKSKVVDKSEYLKLGSDSSTYNIESYTNESYLNGIGNSNYGNIFIYLYENGGASYSDVMLRFKRQFAVSGLEGERVFVINIDDSEYSHEEFSAKIQALFFEKNSTFVLSYSNVSDNFASLIKKRGIRIGNNYEQLIFDKVENDVSYIFKVDDGINSEPKQLEYELQIGDEDVDLSKLFFDNDNDTLFFTLKNANSSISIDRFGMLSLSDGTLPADGTIIKLDVSDGEMSIDADIKIKYRNYPPKLTINTFDVYTSEAFSINLYDYISNPEDEVVSIKAVNAPLKFNFVDGVISGLLLKYDRPLSETLLVQVSDGYQTVTEEISLNLILKNHPPFSSIFIQPITLEQGSSTLLYLDGYFDDLDKDKLTFSSTSSLVSIQYDAQNRSVLLINSTILGVHNIDINVDDNSGGKLIYNLSVTVTARSVSPEEPSDTSSGSGSLNYYCLCFLLLLVLFRNWRICTSIISHQIVVAWIMCPFKNKRLGEHSTPVHRLY